MNDYERPVYLITGASRGLGKALAGRLDAEGAALFLVARSPIEAAYGDAVTCQVDLSDPVSTVTVLSAFEGFLRDRSPESVTLINNAGTVSPVRPAHRAEFGEMDTAIRLNLVAPMALTAGFIRVMAHRAIEKRVVNISSGAAHSPYAGWSTYCAGKAGLAMFTRCVGLEQERESSPVTVVSLAPGIIDTAMQGEIRKSNSADFPMIDKFLDLKRSGEMPTADEAADKIARFLFTHELTQGAAYDIREL